MFFCFLFQKVYLHFCCYYKTEFFWNCIIRNYIKPTTEIQNFLIWYFSDRASLYRLVSNYQLNAQFLYSSTIYMFHYDLQHISSSTLFILRRTNCITTASGISPLSTCILYGYLQRVMIQRLWWYNLSSWGWAACCSKHVKDRSVTYILLKNKGIVHEVGNLKKSILWSTVRKTSN